LRSTLAKSLVYLRDLVAAFPPPRAASPQSWATDPYIRAFFATASDVAATFAWSRDLADFFERAPGLNEAYAVLGMEMIEHRTLGASQEGGITRSDVPRTTLSFSDQQIRICGSSVSALREEIAGRMVDQLAVEALAQIAADCSRRDELGRERALLSTRLRILERQGMGMSSLTGGDTQPNAAEAARLRQQMDENDYELRRLGSFSEVFDRELECVCEVFSDPDKRIHISPKQVRLSRMNVVLSDEAAEDAHLLDLEIVRVAGDPPRERAIALVRVSRFDVPKPANLLDEAARLLR